MASKPTLSCFENVRMRLMDWLPKSEVCSADGCRSISNGEYRRCPPNSWSEDVILQMYRAQTREGIR